MFFYVCNPDNCICEKGLFVVKIRWINALSPAAIAAVFLAGAGAHGQSGYKSFQLVYHSDTRGYYRPCG